MKPTEYEALINQLIDNKVDMDELRSLVAAEQEKRKKEAEDAKARELKQQRLNASRSDLIDAMIGYAEDLIEDPDTWEYLESEEGYNQIETAIKDFENNLKKFNSILNSKNVWADLVRDFNYDNNKKDAAEDALKIWLKEINKRK